MGDRALIQLIDKDRQVSPSLYIHWGGEGVACTLHATQKRMEGRPNDLDYSFARLVQIAIGDDDSNLSFGVSNRSTAITEDDSPGDAGVFLVDISTTPWTVMTAGGYGLDDTQYPDEVAALNVIPLAKHFTAVATVAEAVYDAISEALNEQALRLMREQRNESIAQQAAELMQLFADGLEILQPDDDDHAVLATVLSDTCRNVVGRLAPTD